MTTPDPVALTSIRTTLPILDSITLTASCTQILQQARARVAELEKIPLIDVTAENILDRFDADAIAIEDVIGPVAILNHVHPDWRVRDAADECILALSAFTTELYQNEKIFERVRKAVAITPAQKQLQKDILDAFEDSGVALPAGKRKRFKEISDRLTELSQEFGKNERENQTRLTFTAEEYDGLPQAWINRLKDGQGNVTVGFDSPDFVPFMSNSRNAEARRRYFVAYNNRGTPRNLEILDEIVKLRKEIATLYDLPSYAHYVTKRRMVENPETVLSFLNDVKKAVTVAERNDLDELRRFKAEMTGLELGQVKIERWDVSYYREQLREKRYAIDQEGTRKYFPFEESLSWLLATTSHLYGLRFEKTWVPVWHEDIRYFDVFDDETGEFLGGIYLDLFPREGKYKHAAAWPVRGVSTKTGRKPISVLVTNFDRKGLTHNEVETFFHEFGHVMHGVLSKTTYNLHAGTTVQRDFVEAPSQMYEEWTRRLASVRRIAEVCPECPIMDEELVDRLEASRRFGKGSDYARQLLYASFDMALAGPNPGNALEVWRSMEGATPLGHVEGTEFPGTFGHLAAGYAAGYYGYMWSEVLALDFVSAWDDDIMNPEIGRRYREMILSRGGEAPAKEIVEQFLGRAPKSEAFFREITGRR